jgi:ADP-ribose pyrophosphatase
VRREKCITPSGKIVDPYYVYDFPAWVSAVALTDDGNVVLVKQYRHAVGEIGIELPGGCVDDTDEDFNEAIARELSEETGYTFSDYKYLGKISANTSTNSNWLHMFLATGGKLTGKQKLDENEEIQVVVVSLEELKKMLRENSIPQAMHVSCILYALAELNEISFKE